MLTWVDVWTPSQLFKHCVVYSQFYQNQPVMLPQQLLRGVKLSIKTCEKLATAVIICASSFFDLWHFCHTSSSLWWVKCGSFSCSQQPISTVLNICKVSSLLHFWRTECKYLYIASANFMGWLRLRINRGSLTKWVVGGLILGSTVCMSKYHWARSCRSSLSLWSSNKSIYLLSTCSYPDQLI